MDALENAVTIPSFSTFEFQKQSKVMMQGVQIEKNHEKWLRIGEEFLIWRLVFLMEFWEFGEFLDPTLENVSSVMIMKCFWLYMDA